MRRFYFGHLSDVVMIPTHTMTAERLGGADFDGDMVKTIADLIVNRCVKRNYDSLPHDPLNNRRNLPLLKIPAETAMEFVSWYDLLCDFRFGGYRVLGDVVCDVNDENAASDHRKLFRESDTPNFATMMEAYTQHPFARNYRETVAEKCRELLDGIVKPKFAVLYVVALGKRKLLWELLPDQIKRHVVRLRHEQRMG